MRLNENLPGESVPLNVGEWLMVPVRAKLSCLGSVQKRS
jgi:hypothetical protein